MFRPRLGGALTEVIFNTSAPLPRLTSTSLLRRRSVQVGTSRSAQVAQY
ncbi:hypothetical protein [Nostoc sp.]